jgi:hypothetical protein
MLLRHLQDMRVDDVIMTCNMSRPRAAVPHYSATLQCIAHAADCSRARLADATTRQDEGYTVDHTPRGTGDRIGCTGCRLCHHHVASAFNALDTFYDLLYPGATCRALGHSVTT